MKKNKVINENLMQLSKKNKLVEEKAANSTNISVNVSVNNTVNTTVNSVTPVENIINKNV